MARILVVDDVKFISRLLADLLAREGHRVRVADDGVEALEGALADPPDLILLDITLPRMNGLDVARILKSDPATSDVPIMMITSRRDDAAVHTAIEAGVDDFLTKPFDDEALLARVESLLAKRAVEAPGEAGSPGGVSILAPAPGATETAGALESLRTLLNGGEGEAAPRTVVVDLSHLDGVGPAMADVIVAIRESAARAEEAGGVGPRVEVVRPVGTDLCTRLAMARIARVVAVHDDRPAALAAADRSSPSAGG